MILATFRILFHPAKHSEVAKILTRIVERTHVELGCISSHLYIDAQDQRGFVIEEVWMTNDDLVRHLRSEEFLDVLLVTEIAVEATEIRFSSIMPVNDMETIEKVRG